VGAVVGIGLAHGIESTNFHIVRKIFISWIITLPVGAILAIIFYYILRMFFG
jgi:PiT family inorganic phosphate transporter